MSVHACAIMLVKVYPTPRRMLRSNGLELRTRECQEITHFLAPGYCVLPKPAFAATIVASFGLSHRLRALVLCVRGCCQLRRCRCMLDKRVSDQNVRYCSLRGAMSTTISLLLAGLRSCSCYTIPTETVNDILHPRDAFPQPATTCVRSAARRHWIHDLHDPGAARKLCANRAPRRTAGIHAIQRCGAPGGSGKRWPPLRLPAAQASLL